jgi:hypothetical protein
MRETEHVTQATNRFLPNRSDSAWFGGKNSNISKVIQEPLGNFHEVLTFASNHIACYLCSWLGDLASKLLLQ